MTIEPVPPVSSIPSPAPAHTFCPPERRVYVLVAAILASAMGFIDGSVIAIALPDIRVSLNASLADAQWIANGYMLFMASLILIGGAAGDRFGLRKIFSGGIGLFILASLASALAPNPQLLIVARAIQGIGAAFMVPGSLSLIAKAYPRAERGRAIGIWATAASLTTILGPVIGGFALTVLGPWSWRLVFAINLPLGIVALAALWFKVPADQPAEARALDIVGGALITVALLLITLGLTGSGGEGGSVPDSREIVVYCGVGVVLIGAFLFWETRTKAPMMPLALFANVRFSGANGLTFLLYFALSAISFYQPMTLIAGWKVDPAQVAVSFLPLGIFLTLLSRMSGGLADRFGPAPPVAGGAVLVAIAFGGLALLAPLQNLWLGVLPLMGVMGVGMGFVVSPLSTAVMTSVEDHETGTASGINNAVSRVAGLLAVALMGGVVSFVFQRAVAGTGAEGLSFGRPPGAALTAAGEAVRVTATNAAFSAVAWITAGMALCSALVAWLTLERKSGGLGPARPGRRPGGARRNEGAQETP